MLKISVYVFEGVARVKIQNDAEKALRVGDTAATVAAGAAAASSDDDDDSNAADSKQEEPSPRSRVLRKDDCLICLEQMSNPKELDCGHKFCEDCIAAYFEKGQPKCPSCGKLFGVLKGNQPPGTFTSRYFQQLKLSGYERYGAIEITYHIPDGIQTVSNVL